MHSNIDTQTFPPTTEESLHLQSRSLEVLPPRDVLRREGRHIIFAVSVEHWSRTFRKKNKDSSRMIYLNFQVHFAGLHNSIRDYPLVEPAAPIFEVNKISVYFTSVRILGHI